MPATTPLAPAAGLAALGDQAVGAPTESGTGLRRGAHHHEDEDAGIAKVLYEPPLLAEGQDDAVDPGIHAHRDVRTTHEGQQQVYRNRAIRHPLAHPIDRRAQLPGRGQAQGAQAARRGRFQTARISLLACGGRA